MTSRWLCALGFVFVVSLQVPVQAESVSSRKVDASNQAVFPVRWQQSLVREGTHRQSVISPWASPAVSNKHNLVIVGTGEGNLFGLDTRRGGVVWSREFAAEFEAFGAIAALATGEEVVLLSTRDGKFHAVSNGVRTTQWTTDLGALKAGHAPSYFRVVSWLPRLAQNWFFSILTAVNASGRNVELSQLR